MNPIVIKLMLTGLSTVNAGINQTGQAAKQMGSDVSIAATQSKTALTSMGSAATSAGAAQVSAGRMAASAWSPAIAAVHQMRAALKQAQSDAKALAAQQKAAATPVNGPGSASAWNPYISAVQSAKAQATQAKAQAQAAQAQARADAQATAQANRAAQQQTNAQARADAQAARQAAKAQAQADAQAARDTALGPMAKYIPRGGKLAAFNAAYGDAHDAAEERAGNLAQAGGTVRNIGLTMGAAGAGGALLLGKAVSDAGQMQQFRNAFRQQLGDSAGDAQLAAVTQFAKDSPALTLEGSVHQSQMLMATGFDPSEIIPALTALGNIAAGTGQQGPEVTDRLATNLGQIRNMAHPEERDLKEFSHAGINVEKIISAAMGKAMSRDDIKKMSGQDFTAAFIKGANTSTQQGGYGGAMAAQLDTLPGQLSRLNDSLFQLGSIVGTSLLPPLQWLVGQATGVVDFFASLPGWLQTILSYGGALAAGLLIIGGGFLTLAGSAASSVVSILALNASLVEMGILSGTAGAGIFGALIPALAGLAAMLAPFALAAVVAAGALWVAKKYMDELAKPTETVQDDRSSDQIAADDKSEAAVRDELDKSKGFSDADRYAVLRSAVKKKGDLGDTDGIEDIHNEMDRLRKKDKDILKKSKGTLSTEAQQTVSRIDALAAGNKAARLAAAPMPTQSTDPNAAQAAAIQQQIAALPQAGAASGAGIGAYPTALPPASGMAGGGMAAPALGAPSYAARDDVEALQDQIAETDDKDQKKALHERLRLAQRSARHAREDDAEGKREERAHDKAERDAERARKLKVRGLDREASANAKVEEANLNADLAVQIAQMKAAGASKGDIERVKAAAEERRAQIRASGAGSDGLKGMTALRVSQARARALEGAADSEGNGSEEGGNGDNTRRLRSLLSFVRNGGNLFDLARQPQKRGGGNDEGEGQGDDYAPAANRDTVTNVRTTGTLTHDTSRHVFHFEVTPVTVVDQGGRDAEML